MDNKLRNLLGLLNTGKRVFQLKDGDVETSQFEYAVVINQILFGEKGLVDTLGPTWNMVHDPRFAVLENMFVTEGNGKVGGDARHGLQRQDEDGHFSNTMDAIEQYAEILGEGRNIIGMLKSRAILDAVQELFPGRNFRFDHKSSFGPLRIVSPYSPGIREEIANFGPQCLNDNRSDEELVQDILDDVANAEQKFADLGVLTPAEKRRVVALAATYEIYKPHNVKFWPDNELWKLLMSEYENYFSRKGTPNKLAKQLFNIIKADLCGLVADFAEVANVQEKVLLDDTAELYDPAVHDEEVAWVSMEVENLERALSYRAELRATAYQVLNQIGVTRQLGPDGVELTDLERDKLMQIIFHKNSDFITNKAATVSAVLGFIGGIRAVGKSFEVRHHEQLAKLQFDAQTRVQALQTGEAQPISRYSDEIGPERELTPEEAMVRRMMMNPIASHTFHRLNEIEKRLKVISGQFSPWHLDTTLGEMAPVFPRLQKVMEEFVQSVLGDFEAPESYYAEAKESRAILGQIARLTQAREVLRPVFEDPHFEWTDESACELLTKVEVYDPTPGLKTVELPEGSDPGAPETVN